MQLHPPLAYKHVDRSVREVCRYRCLAVVVEAPGNPVKGLNSLKEDPNSVASDLHSMDGAEGPKSNVEVRIDDRLEKLLNLL